MVKGCDGTYPANCSICGYTFGEETAASAPQPNTAQPKTAPPQPAVAPVQEEKDAEKDGTYALAYALTIIVVIAFIILAIVVAVKYSFGLAVFFFILICVALNFGLTKIGVVLLLLMIFTAFHAK